MYKGVNFFCGITNKKLLQSEVLELTEIYVIWLVKDQFSDLHFFELTEISKDQIFIFGTFGVIGKNNQIKIKIRRVSMTEIDFYLFV